MAKNEISRPQTANIPPFGLRLQPELRALIEDAARAAGRSMNAEIVSRLLSTFSPQRELFTKEELLNLLHAAIDERIELEAEKKKLIQKTKSNPGAKK